jgi:hypothetical protein
MNAWSIETCKKKPFRSIGTFGDRRIKVTERYTHLIFVGKLKLKKGRQ